MTRLLFLVMASLLLITGCQEKQNNPASMKQIQQKNQEMISIDPREMEEAKKIAQQNKRVDQATAVTFDHELFVALKVSNFNRFFLRSTRSEVHKNLRKRFSNKEVHVTTDSKLFDELSKIEKQIDQQPQQPEKVLEKKLKKINKDMKG